MFCKWNIPIGRFGWHPACIKGKWAEVEIVSFQAYDGGQEDETQPEEIVAEVDGGSLARLFAAADHE